MNITTSVRNRDFIASCKSAYRHLAAAGSVPTVMQIVQHVLAGNAPSYYVDAYRANRILIPALSSRKLPGGDRPSAEMWRDMLADLRRLQRLQPRRHAREHILELCNGRAGRPRFYLSVRRAMELASQHFEKRIFISND